MRRQILPSHVRAMNEAAIFSANLKNDPSSVDYWALYHRGALRTLAALLACPFTAQAIETAATGVIPETGLPLQLDWDALTDDDAARLSTLIRAIGFSVQDVTELSAGLNAPILQLAQDAERLAAAGLIYPDDRGRLHLSPLGKPAYADLDSRPHAIRPAQAHRLQNRRRR